MSKKIYTIDAEYIVNMQKERLLKAYKNGRKMDDVIDRENERIMKVLEAIAKQNNAIILAKKAVVAGDAQDITEIVLKKAGVALR